MIRNMWMTPNGNFRFKIGVYLAYKSPVVNSMKIIFVTYLMLVVQGEFAVFHEALVGFMEILDAKSMRGLHMDSEFL